MDRSLGECGSNTSEFNDLLDHYDSELSEQRGNRYFTLMKAFFANYHEFGQVYFHVAKGMDIPEGHIASSSDFHGVRMFYGNAFEAFASSVDVLAYLNNLIMNRSFNDFGPSLQKDYLKLDKARRFDPFSMNEPFMALCGEKDNKLRNASHHGSFEFDDANQMIRYRTGKGGTGPEQCLSYVSYLARCNRVFLQVTTLLRMEVMLCHGTGRRPPY